MGPDYFDITYTSKLLLFNFSVYVNTAAVTAAAQFKVSLAVVVLVNFNTTSS